MQRKNVSLYMLWICVMPKMMNFLLAEIAIRICISGFHFQFKYNKTFTFFMLGTIFFYWIFLLNLNISWLKSFEVRIVGRLFIIKTNLQVGWVAKTSVAVAWVDWAVVWWCDVWWSNNWCNVAVNWRVSSWVTTDKVLWFWCSWGNSEEQENGYHLEKKIEIELKLKWLFSQK